MSNIPATPKAWAAFRAYSMAKEEYLVARKKMATAREALRRAIAEDKGVFKPGAATADRNRAIYAARLNGATFAELGRQYGISPGRVSGIYRKEARLAKRREALGIVAAL